ncbi:nuclear transport factor 2 family protein [Sphaerisporangium sp. NPDC051011]|uniref:nuclear transport factor 2 family protein n=1 Tax=Sphaerisporangium sp. NPDC051011 TaxID=3155792 RepID=UPI0033F2852F
MNEPSTMATAEVGRIRDLLSQVAYVLDSHDYDRLGEVFAEDVHFENPGRLVAHGLPSLIEAFKKITDPAVSHHVTNVIVTPVDGGSAECVTKALTLRKGGVLSAAEYRDTVRLGADGWRISSRSIRPLG